MNILFISSDVNPFGAKSNGDSQRTRLLLQACARLGTVDLVTFRSGAVSDIDNVTVVYSGPVNDALPQKTRIAKWLSVMPWGGMQSLFPIAKERERIIDDIVASGHYDLIVSRYLFRTLPCGLLKYGKRLVVDADDDDVVTLLGGPENQAADTSEAVDTYFDLFHCYVCIKLVCGSIAQM